jgi:hypothetical protein
MQPLAPEEEEKVRDSAPRATFVLMLIFAAAMLAGWAYMFFLMFLEHGTVS